MKKLLIFITFIFSFILCIGDVSAKAVNVYVFHSDTCSHCKAAIRYLESIKDRYDLNVYKYEVNDEGAKDKIKIVEDYFDVSIASVPVVIINNRHMRGYSDTTTSQMYLYNIKLASDPDFVDEIGIKLGEVNENVVKKENKKVYKISLFNKTITLKDNTFYNSVILGITKSINPIIIFGSLLLSLIILVLGKNYKYVLLNIIIDLIMCLLFSLNIFNLKDMYEVIVVIRILVALLIIIIGLLNINKDVSLYNSKKLDKIISLLKNSVVILLVFVIYSIFISIIKISVIGNIPSLLSNVSLGYKLVYTICYMVINVLAIFFVFGLIKLTKLNKYKYCKLIYGIILFLIGALLIIKPTLLGL